MNNLVVIIILIVLIFNLILYRMSKANTFREWSSALFFVFAVTLLILIIPFIAFLMIGYIETLLGIHQGMDGSRGGGFIVFLVLLLLLTCPLTVLVKFFVVPRLSKL